MADAVVIIGASGRVVYSNAAARQSGLGAVDWPDAAGIHEISVPGIDGNDAVFEITNTPIQAEDGAVIGLLAVARDATGQRRDQGARRDRERQLAEAEAVGMGSWEWEPATGRVEWSDGLYDVLGIDRSEPPSIERFLAQVHPDDRAAVGAALADPPADPLERTVECRLVLANGEVRWAAGRGRVAERAADGSPTRIVGIAVDLTAAKRAAADREALRAVILASDEAMYTMSMDGDVTTWNEGAERMFGYRAKEALGRSVLDLIVPTDRVRETLHLVQEVRRGHRVSLPITVRRRRDGRLIPVEITAGPIADERGEVVGAAAVARDLSEHLALMEQAGRADRVDAVGQVASGIAHDFANVLTAVDGFVRVGRQKAAAGEDVAGELDGIATAAASGTSLVRRLLEFVQSPARLPCTFDAVDVVDDLLPVLRQLTGPGIDIAVRRPHEAVRVRGDANQLEHVIVNLVVNARDAMQGEGRIDIAVDRVVLVHAPPSAVIPLEAGAYAAVTVADTGPGMDEETVQHCVEPFFTTKPKGAGTGLGLASVASVARAVRGSLEIRSAPGQGTAATLYWPMGDQDAGAPGEGWR